MVAHTSATPGQVRESNHYQVLWREGRAAAQARLPRDTRHRGLERRVWLEGYDTYTQNNNNTAPGGEQ